MRLRTHLLLGAGLLQLAAAPLAAQNETPLHKIITVSITQRPVADAPGLWFDATPTTRVLVASLTPEPRQSVRSSQNGGRRIVRTASFPNDRAIYVVTARAEVRLASGRTRPLSGVGIAESEAAARTAAIADIRNRHADWDQAAAPARTSTSILPANASATDVAPPVNALRRRWSVTIAYQKLPNGSGTENHDVAYVVTTSPDGPTMQPSAAGPLLGALAEWLMPETYSFSDLQAQAVAELDERGVRRDQTRTVTFETGVAGDVHLVVVRARVPLRSGTTVDIFAIGFGTDRSAAEAQAVQRLGGRVWSYDRAQHPPSVVEARVYRGVSPGSGGSRGD
jgi:hypothetical protein